MSGSSSIEGRPGASPYTSSVEIWRIRFRSFLRPASRTDQVPITSVRTKSPASRMDRWTWVSPAKWSRDAALVRLFVVVQFRGEVHEVHRFGSDRLETVDDVRRDLDHHGVPLARKELVHLAFRRGPVAIVVADDLCRPAHHDEMIRLLLV